MSWTKKEAGIKEAQLAALASRMLGALYQALPVLGDLVREGNDWDELNEAYEAVKGVIAEAEGSIK
jgi:hypothetical protein